jgi:membrane protein YqaA with SNARE-associated domain
MVSATFLLMPLEAAVISMSLPRMRLNTLLARVSVSVWDMF